MGGSFSKSTNNVKNMLSASMETAMESNVNGDLNVACSNTQLVEGARGCHITFADQICKAVGISNMTSNTSLDANLSQDIVNELSAAASSSVEGLSLQLAQVSNASNIINNQVSLSMDTTMTFNTRCTRNLSAINEQTVRDCENSTIQFAAQDVSGEVIGDCVANQAGSLQAAQSLTNVLDLEADSSTKGVDLWAIVMLMAGFFLIFILGIPIFFFGMRYALTKRTNQIPYDPNVKYKYMAIGVIAFAMFLVAIIWWPFGFSIVLGIAPWRYLGGKIGDDCGGSGTDCRELLCANGKSVDPDVVINSFMWYDPYCLSKSATTAENPKGTKYNGACPTEDKIKHYHQCGLFATTDGCDDPEFLQHKIQYMEIAEACGAPGIAGAAFNSCSTGDIAVEMFAEDEDSYGDCHKCVGTSAAELNLENPRINYGLWAEKDASCSFGIDKEAYIRDSGTPCSASDPDCKENEEDFKAVSPNECRHSAYQMRKKRFSQAFKGCKKVQEHALMNEETLGYMPLLSQQCPPNPFEYFTKCSAASKACTYAAKGCVCDESGTNCDCSNADQNIVASCRNDMSACCTEDELGIIQCRDQQLQADMNVWKEADKKCQMKQESENWFHPWGWVIPLIFYILCIIFIVFIVVRNKSVSASLLAASSTPTTSKTWNYGFLIFFMVCILAAGWPFGILAVVHAGGRFSMYDENFRSNMKDFDADTASYIGYPVFGIGCLGLIYMIYRLLRKPPSQTQMIQK